MREVANMNQIFSQMYTFEDPLCRWCLTEKKSLLSKEGDKKSKSAASKWQRTASAFDFESSERLSLSGGGENKVSTMQQAPRNKLAWIKAGPIPSRRSEPVRL